MVFDPPEVVQEIFLEGLNAAIAEEEGECFEILRRRRQGMNLPVVLHLQPVFHAPQEPVSRRQFLGRGTAYMAGVDQGIQRLQGARAA